MFAAPTLERTHMRVLNQARDFHLLILYIHLKVQVNHQNRATLCRYIREYALISLAGAVRYQDPIDIADFTDPLIIENEVTKEISVEENIIGCFLADVSNGEGLLNMNSDDNE